MACASLGPVGGAGGEVGETTALTSCRVLDIQFALAVGLFAEAALDDPPRLPFIQRGADPERDLTWMLMGAGRATLAYDDAQHFDYELPSWMRKDLAKVAKALSQVRTTPGRQVVYGVLVQLCLLQSPSEQTGKIPYGVVLGYLAQTGKRMARHRHIDEDGRVNFHVLPAGECGSNPLNDMMGIGSGLNSLSHGLVAEGCDHADSCIDCVGGFVGQRAVVRDAFGTLRLARPHAPVPGPRRLEGRRRGRHPPAAVDTPRAERRAHSQLPRGAFDGLGTCPRRRPISAGARDHGPDGVGKVGAATEGQLHFLPL